MKETKETKKSKTNVGSGKADAVSETRSPGGRMLTREASRCIRRGDALFKAMATDYLLREQFVTDPAQIMSEYIHGERLSEETADSANQLLYAVVSNPRLQHWMVTYSRELGGGTPSRHAFAVHFAKAVANRGDEFTTLALIRGASEAADAFVAPAELLRSIITVIGSRFGTTGGTEMSPGTGGTEQSPGGTEMSPGRVFAGTEKSPGGGTERSPGVGTERSPGAVFAGTEMSPGTGGTEQSPGGTEMSPGRVFAGTEMSPGTGGTEQSPGGTEMSPGRVFAGTEMSPGGGTEQSPGGTQMSPGAIASGQLPGYLRVTLNALAQYASQLRAEGGLISTGLEGR